MAILCKCRNRCLRFFRAPKTIGCEFDPTFDIPETYGDAKTVETVATTTKAKPKPVANENSNSKNNQKPKESTIEISKIENRRKMRVVKIHLKRSNLTSKTRIQFFIYIYIVYHSVYIYIYFPKCSSFFPDKRKINSIIISEISK